MSNLISTLNNTARSLNTGDPVRALELAAAQHGLVMVAEDGATRTYRTAEGSLVNCWVDAPAHEITEGGLGYDDQVSVEARKAKKERPDE